MASEFSQFQELDEINEIEILQFERGNTPLELEPARHSTDFDNKNPYSGDLRTAKKKKPDMNQGPDWLDSIGCGFGNLNPQVIQLAREMGGGLISRFAFFQNVFRPDTYEQSDVAEKNQVIKRPDRHIQIMDLCTGESKECYPSIKMSLMEQELENFSKQIVASINAVLYKSSTSQTAQWPAVQQLDLHTIVSIADPSKSTLSHNSSLGTQPLGSPSNTYQPDKSGLYKRISDLQEQVDHLKKEMESKDAIFNRARKDYMRDNQNLRNALYLSNNPVNRMHGEAVKLAANVYNFNDMEGLSPELKDFFNEKVQILKEEFTMQLEKSMQDKTALNETIEKYKMLKPVAYSLMEMDLKDIFDGVAIIEPTAFPVWKALLHAFPKGHFSAIIKQIAESLTDDNDETYDKLIKMVQDGIDKNMKTCDRALDAVRQRSRIIDVEVSDMKQQLDQSEWRLKDMLAKQEQQQRETHQELMRNELDKQAKLYGTEKKKLEIQVKLMKEEIERLHRRNEFTDMRMALFKWRQSGLFSKFVQQVDTNVLDRGSLKDLMLEDMRKLFFGPEMSQAMNSLKQTRQLHKTAENQLKAMQSENHQLRLKVNTMLAENQSVNWQLERMISREADYAKIIETEKKKRNDAFIDLQRQKAQQDKLNQLLASQIELREQAQDKLNETLDFKSNSIGLSSSSVDRSAKGLRQKQTKRVVAGFKIEVESLLYLNTDAANKLSDTAFDPNHGQPAIDRSCQTEIQGTQKILELVVVNNKPVNIQSTSLPMIDQGNQTNISGNVIDFMAQGSKKYENFVKSGLIKGSAKLQIEEAEGQQYMNRLHDQEQIEGILTTQRPILGSRKKQAETTSRVMSQQNSASDATLSGRSAKNKPRNQSSRVVSPKGISQISASKGSSQRRQETNVDIKKIQHSVTSGFDSRDEVKEEDSVDASDFAMVANNSTRRVKSNMPVQEQMRSKKSRPLPTKTLATKSSAKRQQTTYESNTPQQRSEAQPTETDIVDDSYPKRLKPKLNKQNADLSSSSSGNMNASTPPSSRDSSSDPESVSNLQTGMTQDLRQLQTSVLHVRKSEPNMQQYFDQDYRGMVEKKNVQSQFEAYMQVFELMMKMEPKLFKTAVQTVKKHRSFKLDIKTIKRLKKLYPNLLPPVYQRLLYNQPDAKERMVQKQILQDAKQAWRNKLRDRGLIDETELPATEGIASGQLSPTAGNIVQDEGKVSDTQRTQNTSMPYLSPVNFTTSEAHSLNSMRNQQKQENATALHAAKKLPLAKVHQSLSPSLNTRKTVESKVNKNQNGESEESDETMTQVSMKEIQPADGESSPVRPHEITKGFYSMPNSAYDMRVSVLLPKQKRKAASRSSLNASRSRKSRAVRQTKTDQQSWHLMVNDSRQSNVLPKASRMPRNAATCFSKSQRVDKNYNESITLNVQSPMNNQDGDIVVMQASDTVPLTSTKSGGQASMQFNSLAAELAQEGQVSDYDATQVANTIQIGEKSLPKEIQLARRFIKRPATANKQSNRLGRNCLKNSTTGSIHNSQASQVQFLFKQGTAGGSTLAQTVSTGRAMSQLENHQAGKATALSTNFDKRGTSTSQGMSGQIITDKSVNSLHQTTYNTIQQRHGGQSGACPVKAFDMSNIPINPQDWQNQKQRLSNISSPLSRIIGTKTVYRAQSATQNRNQKKLNSVQSAQGNVQMAMKSMNKNGNHRKTIPINKVAIKVAQRINVNSEEELEHLKNQEMQYVDAEGKTRTLLKSHINEQGRVSQVTMLRVSEMDYAAGKTSQMSNNEPSDEQQRGISIAEEQTMPSPKAKHSLIKVSDQLERVLQDGRSTHQARYLNQL